MPNLPDSKKCVGCFACFNVCPIKCIDMVPDEDGFLNPLIDDNKCIKCGLCEKSCPVLNERALNSEGVAYACINKNEETRLKSSSGGIFSLIAEHIIEKGGIVFGAAFDDDLSICHTEADNITDAEKFRGAKYVQSRIEDTYILAKNYLEAGKTVLFSGTPCQIGGLKSFLKKDYENLITQDIICHGVPSEKVWYSYLKWQKGKYGLKGRIKANFRDKITGWMGYSVTVEDETRKISTIAKENLYMRAFLQDLCLRESCYNCQFKSIERESDITLGDFWGINNIIPDMNDNKGTSLVLINSEKGQKIFGMILEKTECIKVDINDALRYNSASYTSAKKPPKRDLFMKLLEKGGFEYAAKKCIKKRGVRGFAKKIKTIIKKLRK